MQRKREGQRLIEDPLGDHRSFLREADQGVNTVGKIQLLS